MHTHLKRLLKHTHILVGGKKSWSKILNVKSSDIEIFCKKIFAVRKILEPKKTRVLKNFGSNKIGRKKFWVKNNFGKKNFGQKEFPGQKFFLSKHI